MGLKITYVHSHSCKHKDKQIEDRPDNSDGVSWIRIPTCEETLQELERIDVEKY